MRIPNQYITKNSAIKNHEYSYCSVPMFPMVLMPECLFFGRIKTLDLAGEIALCFTQIRLIIQNARSSPIIHCPMSIPVQPTAPTPAPTIAARRPHPRSKFTPVEDNLLVKYVQEFGDSNWETISKLIPNRNPRQCRERWTNYLSPTVSKAPFTPEEDALLEQKHKELGPKWVNISKFFQNRTDTMLKNRYLVLSRRATKFALRSQEPGAKELPPPIQIQAATPPQPPQPPQPQPLPPQLSTQNLVAVTPQLTPQDVANLVQSAHPPIIIHEKGSSAPIPPKWSYKLSTSPVPSK